MSLMPRPRYFSNESLDSFVAEFAYAYEKAPGAPERRTWTNEELSRIRRELRNITAIRVPNSADVEDIVQDTLLTLIHNCPRECLEKGPLVWSIGVLRNKIGNYYRKGRCRAKCEINEAEPRQDLSQFKTAVSPESDLLHGELRNIIADTVERLPSAQKTAMKMLIAGLKPGEIAAKMSPERYQAVINHLYRGRKKLAQELTMHGFGGMHEMRRARGAKGRMLDKNEETDMQQQAIAL